MDTDVQNSILNAIDIMVKQGVSNIKLTSSTVGLVKKVSGFECVVEIANSEYKCVLMEHLHDWIDVDDIVIIQDLYNDNTKKAVIGKIGTTRTTSFTIYDTQKQKSISGVDALFDEETGTRLDVDLEIE